MRLLVGIFLVASACSPVDDQGAYTQAELDAARAQGYAAAIEEVSARPAELTNVTNEAAPAHVENPAPVSLCWQDYCPCEPPQGGPDAGLCRQLKAGLPVGDDIMSAAAMMRDGRKQMEDFEAEHGEF